MILEEALIALANQEVDDRNDWYCWNEIDPSRLPKGVSLPIGNAYAKNVALKYELHRLWQRSDEHERFALAKCYVTTWGGVRRNKAATLKAYVTEEPDVIIKRGRNGVASWSKVLCIRDPKTYAIFDARVSTALNALQIIYDTPGPILFPLLPGQNKTIQAGNEKMKGHATAKGWGIAAEREIGGRYEIRAVDAVPDTTLRACRFRDPLLDDKWEFSWKRLLEIAQCIASKPDAKLSFRDLNTRSFIERDK
jgi:hypothetical protein